VITYFIYEDIKQIQLKLTHRTCLLSRQRVQEIKRMYLVLLTHGFFFNRNTKQRYSQITNSDTHSHRYMYTRDDSLSIHPLLLSITLVFLFLCSPTPLFYLLGDPASFARGANSHPLLPLVCYQLFSPCCFTHPKAPHRSSYIFT
jgi:hypothetical protein